MRPGITKALILSKVPPASPAGAKQLGGKQSPRPSLWGRTNTIKMNIMLKLNHLIGMLVLKILESLLKKKGEKSQQFVLPSTPRGFRKTAGPREVAAPPDPKQGSGSPNPQPINYDYYPHYAFIKLSIDKFCCFYY